MHTAGRGIVVQGRHDSQTLRLCGTWVKRMPTPAMNGFFLCEETFASSQKRRMVSYGAVETAVTGETGRASNRGRSPGLVVAAAALCVVAIVVATASWTQVACVHVCVRPLRTAELPRQSP